MLSCQKTLSLNSYKSWTLSNLFTSQFIHSTYNDLLFLKKVNLIIHTRKNKKIHYFYLWLLTRQHPYAKKFFLAEKNISLFAQPFLKVKPKRQRIEVFLKKKHTWLVLHEILWEIISKQINAEKTIWTYQQPNLQLTIPFVPLTKSTFFLQASNSYFPSIPLTLIFSFSCTTAFQKIFFLRALKFLSADTKLKILDPLT